ncbi:MAG: manganese efflux pump MntP family protein [Candidatus Bathyarchaeota archaeon]|nr:manganese efflux pump MntP family protein [Candidatus Bathyarchaeota archaeon]
MDVVSLLLLAVGLSMDVLSVSAVTGFGVGKMERGKMLKLATAFGAFHVFMPVLGWLAGGSIIDMIAEYDHWVAFLLLAFVGGRMLLEGVRGGEEFDPKRILENRSLILFSLAVSVDSVAVGLSFGLGGTPILFPALVIGVTAFAFTLIGVAVGSKTGQWLGRWSQIAGGLILILIGLRVLLSHLMG